jgi:hypothetical protein
MPAIGTPTSPSATLTKPATTLEEALARIADLERHAANKEEEAKRHGKNLTSAEKRLADYEAKERAQQEAALSEAQRSEKRALDAEQLIQRYKDDLISARVELAAHSLGIIDPGIAALAIKSTLEYGDDGLPTNVDDALKALVKSKPYLAPPKPAEQTQATPPATPAQTAHPPAYQTPAIPAMNPGRSSIAAPGSLPPGHITRLSDPSVFKRP